MSKEPIPILLVEDDQNFGDVLKSYLNMHDFEVVLAKDGEEGKRLFEEQDFELCILDVMMPKKDGFTLAREIKEMDADIPLIFLTAKSMKEDVIEGFKTGADDYITKPFHSEELLMRVQAILRRSEGGGRKNEDQKEFEFSKFHFHYPLRILTYKGGDKEKKEKLSPKEAELLRMFCLYKNEVLPRSEALEEIWGEDNYFTARSMDVFVTKLRKYLKPDDNIEIVNIHGNGFQLLIKDEEEVS